MLPLLGVWVRPLVGRLRFRQPIGMVEGHTLGALRQLTVTASSVILSPQFLLPRARGVIDD